MSLPTACTWINKTERVLLALWVGGLWAVGFLVTPVLFAALERTTAGTIAGILFEYLNYFGLVVGSLLMLGNRLWPRPGLDWRSLVLILMVMAILVNQFVLAPAIGELRFTGYAAGSAEALRFGQLHGAASVLYGLNALLGLALVAAGTRRPI